MDLQIPIEASSLIILTTFLLPLLAFLLSTLWWNKPKLHLHPPQPPRSWPLIGHLGLLAGPKLPHISLASLADSYGPIFQIRIGVHPALVVSSRELAKDCLANNDKFFLNRPQSMASELMAYNYAMFGVTNYGPYWREMRKISTVELRSASCSARVLSEAREAIQELHHQIRANAGNDGPVVVDMRKWFGDINLNAMIKLIAGRTLKEFRNGEEYVRCYEAMGQYFHLFGVFSVSDALPFLKWLDIGGYNKAMKKTAKELDHIVQGWLDEHKRVRVPSGGEQDFMDVMLHFVGASEGKFSDFDSEIIVKATCLNMIMAGADTTAVTLTWGLSLLLNNRDALRKVQEELDTRIGRDRPVAESDMNNLVYLQAVLKETMRLYPAGPLLVPHEAIADCTVGGYHVPAGTRLLVNAYKLQRDPLIWAEPLEFRPERFLTTHKDVDFKGQDFEFIPFGSGRRICPGIALSYATMQSSLANLLHSFHVETLSDEPVDMTESLGLVNLKATPLEVILTHRLPNNIYCNPTS